jgi:hypothetical protein
VRRIGRYILTLGIITVLLLLYVHQQVANLQVSYRLNKQQEQLTRMIDTYKNLRFELASLKSPTRVEQKLAEADIALVLPTEVKVVRATTLPAHMLTVAKLSPETKKTSIFSVMGIEREAQAELSQ